MTWAPARGGHPRTSRSLSVEQTASHGEGGLEPDFGLWTLLQNTSLFSLGIYIFNIALQNLGRSLSKCFFILVCTSGKCIHIFGFGCVFRTQMFGLCMICSTRCREASTFLLCPFRVRLLAKANHNHKRDMFQL